MNMFWQQQYLLPGLGLGWSAVAASMPILVLLFLLGVLRKPVWVAEFYGLGVTFLMAIGLYRMPPVIALGAVTHGAAFGLFPISWIVFWAIVLYRMTVETGKFAIIRDSIGRLTEDTRMQGLMIAFALGAFLEGAGGFGTPVAIAAAMLTGLGFSPLRASAVSLLANAAPGAFGALGIPVITLAAVTGLPTGSLSTLVSRICSPVSLILPAYIIAATEGLPALSGAWAAAIAIGFSFASVQLLVSSYLGPQLTDILSALAAFAVMVLMQRMGWLPKARAFDKESGIGESPTGQESDQKHSFVRSSEVLGAWFPYILLVVCVLLWGWRPVQLMLDSANFTFRWPFLDQAILLMPPVVSKPTSLHAMFLVNWLSGAGTACMAATLLSAVYLGMSVRRFLALLSQICRQLAFPTLTVVLVLGIAFLMNDSGATGTLGLAFAATGRLFPFFSVLLGWLGVFLTGSDTSSNALFGSLQVVSAKRLCLDPMLMSSANAVGGAMGKMISLQAIAVAAAATDLTEAEQTRLFRFALRHSAFLVSMVGLLTLLFTWYAGRK
jgi:lactate permease